MNWRSSVSVPNGSVSCNGVSCVSKCNTNYTSCGNACVDTMSDDNNCGQCSSACSGGSHCVGGACTCPGLTHKCNGSCVANNASACGPNCVVCGTGQDCFSGTCGGASAAGCPTGNACDPTSHTCSTTCDGIVSKCNGGCCDNGVCSSGWTATVCGSGGVTCAQSCVLEACDMDPAWNGGSCECDQDSRCVGNPTGPRCVGNAANGGGLCGCLSDADCSTGKCNLVGLNGGAFPGGYCE
jgi:hypothetical protein